MDSPNHFYGKKYLVYPGRVQSKTDGDIHYISFHQLCKLYKVNPEECLNADRASDLRGIPKKALNAMRKLHVRHDGNYGLN